MVSILKKQISLLYTDDSVYSIINSGEVMMKNIQSGKKKDKKVRKLYHLDQSDAQFVQEVAESKGVSESEVIRQAVRTLQEKEKEEPLRSLIGAVKTEPGDAVDHDRVIYE